MAGLEAARTRGRKGGRKPVMDQKKIALASKLMRDRDTPISEVSEAVGGLKGDPISVPRALAASRVSRSIQVDDSHASTGESMGR